MRNKNIFYIVIGLALVLVLSVGYALFSESIQIKGTAKAEGSFDIDITCIDGLSDTVMEYIGPGAEITEKGYSNASCTTSGNIVTYSATLNYPGAQKLFTVKMKNIGSMNAIYNTNTGLTQVKNEFCVDGTNEHNYNGTIESNECLDIRNDSDAINLLSINAQDTYDIILEDENGNYIEDNSSYYNETTGDITLEPGMSMLIMIILRVDDGAGRANDNKLLITQEVINKYTFNQPTAS